MQYVKMWADTPYCGTKRTEFLEFPDEVTNEELNDHCDELSRENADDYSYLATGWGEEFENEDEEEEYYCECSSYSGWEFISEEDFLKATEGENDDETD